MNGFIGVVFQFYGLDWMTMMLGLAGSYLISNQDKRGFALNALACMCGLGVAVISGQVGFVAYNMILIALMLKGFVGWQRRAVTT